MPNEDGRTIARVWESLNSLIKSDLLWWLLATSGFVLRLQQYFENLSLGNDEAALARNIVERTFSGLNRPLDYNQGAPIFFLFIEKFSTVVFGNKDFVLRLFPLISGLVAIYLLVRIAKQHFGMAGLFAVLAFAISASSLYYSSNVKQYSSDVMIALLLVFLSGYCLGEEARAKDFLLLGITGVIAIWLSHPSVFVLAGIVLAIAFKRLSQKDYIPVTWLLALGSVWCLAFGLDYIFSLRSLVTDPYLETYWRQAFMPLPPWNNPRWFVNAYTSLLSMSLDRTSLPYSLSWFTLISIGGVSLFLRKRTFALLILLPFAMTLAASALQKYPFQQRFLLFLVPFVYLLVGEGLHRIYLFAARWNRNLALVAYGTVFLVVFWPAVVGLKRGIFNPVQPWDNMRPVVEYIRENIRKGDAIFVSGGGETFAYYAGSYGLDTGQVVVENSHRIVRYGIYVRDLKAMTGQDRVWVVFAHFEEGRATARYTRYLDINGKITNTFQRGYSRAYLFNLNP
jgi:Dolichyl-phosphate-mannose-protein mannosyltransferase